VTARALLVFGGVALVAWAYFVRQRAASMPVTVPAIYYPALRGGLAPSIERPAPVWT
jgi:hypothetical protein